MSGLLATIRGELDTRMHELHPLVSEYEHLLAQTTDERTVPDAASIVAADSVEVRPLTEHHTNTSRLMTRLGPNRLHRPRRALLRPAFPKAPRRG